MIFLLVLSKISCNYPAFLCDQYILQLLMFNSAQVLCKKVHLKIGACSKHKSTESFGCMDELS